MNATAEEVRSSYAPTPRQIEAHRNPSRFKLYGGAMGGGKSVWLCNSAIRASLKWPGSRWYLGRREAKTFKRTTFQTLEAYMAELSPVVESHHLTDCVYRFANGSQLWYGGLGTQDDREKIKSMELTGFGIDEASEVEESFFLMLSTRLRLQVPGVRYQGLLASNPEPGWLRSRFIDDSRPAHAFIPALPRDNPHLPADYEAGLRELLRGNESWIKAYLEGDWDAFGGTAFVIAYADVRDAAARTLEAKGDECIGVDVARFGDDETTICHRRGPVVLSLQAFNGLDTVQVAGKVKALKMAHPAASVNVDAGYNPGVIDVLRVNGVEVNEVHFGGHANDPEHYADWASEALAGTLAQRFREGAIQIPADDTLKAQLTARQYKMTPRGQTKIESKDDMKKRGLKSPDRADSLMLAFAVAPTITATVRGR